MIYQLTEADITHIAIGTGFLGSGGGGDTKMAEIITKQAIRNGLNIDVIHFDELSDANLIAAVGVIGAPTVLAEKLPSTEEGVNAIQKLETVLQQKINYIIPAEIGGLNGLYAIYIAAQAQKPIVDGDCMGRAFPELQMVTPNIYTQFNSYTAVLANAQEYRVLSAKNLHDLELQARQHTIEMGGIVTIAYLPMTGRQARQYCVPHSISVAQKIGKQLQTQIEHNLIHALNKGLANTEYGTATFIINGKIIELQRNFAQGFNKGWAIIEDNQTQQKIKIDFQNENLRIVDLHTSVTLAIVPTIITLIDNEARPLSCECLRTGLDVTVITLQVPAILRTPKALAIFGPQAFKLNAQTIAA